MIRTAGIEFNCTAAFQGVHLSKCSFHSSPKGVEGWWVYPSGIELSICAISLPLKDDRNFIPRSLNRNIILTHF